MQHHPSIKNVFGDFIGVTLCILLLSSCYTRRPYGYVSEPDPNGVVHAVGCDYVYEKNALGYTVDVATITGCAAGGVLLAPFQNQTLSGMQPNHTVNALTGALIGGAIVLTYDVIFKRNFLDSQKGKTIDPRQWTQDVNDDYLYGVTYDSYLFMVQKSAERRFTPKNMVDMRIFKEAFPNSSETDRVVGAAMELATREELPTILELYPNTSHNSTLKTKYIDLSTSIRDLITAKEQYPEITAYDYETKAYNLIKDAQDAAIFFKHFPKSQHATEVFYKGLNSISRSEIPDFIALAPKSVDRKAINKASQQYASSASSLEKACIEYNALSSSMSKADFLRSMLNAGNIKSYEDLVTIKEKIGYVSGVTEVIVTTALGKKLTPIQLDDVLNLYPMLENKKALEDIYFKFEKSMYDKCVTSTSLSKLDEYLDIYETRRHTPAYLDKISFLYDYQWAKQGSIPAKYDFGVRHPKYAKEMEEDAFKLVKSLHNSYYARLFLEYYEHSKYYARTKELFTLYVQSEMSGNISTIAGNTSSIAGDTRRIAKSSKENARNTKRIAKAFTE